MADICAVIFSPSEKRRSEIKQYFTAVGFGKDATIVDLVSVLPKFKFYCHYSTNNNSLIFQTGISEWYTAVGFGCAVIVG